MNTRELILDMLIEIDKGNAYSNVLIRNVLDKYDYLPVQEKAFIKRVTEGTIERRIQMDYILNYYSKTPVNKMKPLIRNLLRMSAYQLLFMDAVPDSAVCNEAVKLAEKRKFNTLRGFVNGVLRTIARQKENIIYPDRKESPKEYFSVYYSMPEYIIAIWIGMYGENKTEEILKEMMEIRPVTVRIKETLKAEEKADLLRKIDEAGIICQAHPYLPYAYELSHVEGVKNLPGFEEGKLTIQDVSSMFCVEAAGIKEGDFIIDVCAAPGGKTTHAAIKLNGTGKVLSRDLSEEKTALILENKNRQKLNNIEIEVHNATEFDKELVGKADVVFADLPCSGLGILGKKRDIKYNITETMLEELPILQKWILDNVWQYVKPGGILIYSTCTIHSNENEKIADWFAASYPFHKEDISESLPENIRDLAKEKYLQLLPGTHNTDGFFIAKFRRQE